MTAEMILREPEFFAGTNPQAGAKMAQEIAADNDGCPDHLFTRDEESRHGETIEKGEPGRKG
jgi:hypothetical protein